jgi:hypothetical protein
MGSRWDPRLVYYVTNGECCYSRYFQVLNVVKLKIIVSETQKHNLSNLQLRNYKKNMGSSKDPSLVKNVDEVGLVY